MTSQPAVPSANQVADYYGSLGPLLQMAWDDNFHYGYWDGPEDTSSVQEATDRFTDVLIARLRVGPGDRVLDVGCGIGKPALRVASSTGASVVGITISRLQVEQATERASNARMSDRVSFQYADGMDMPFESGSFDAILAFESINHMDRPTALREMARVLVPGGRLALTDVIPPPGTPVPEGDSSMVSSLVRFEDFPGLVEEAGLVLDELTDVSEQTRGTINRLIDGILDSRKDFERRYGTSVQAVLDEAKSALPTSPNSFGCLIMAAHRP
jgi:ubiquinone/menaquinone biosynthesis C-methylase UbiE